MSVHTTIRLGANLLNNAYFEADSINKIYLGTNLLYNNIADFAITETLENVSAVGTHPTSIERGGSLALQYAANANYELPDSVAVAGATSNWNRLTGTLSISNPTAPVTIKVAGVALSKTIPEAPYTLRAEPSLTATHASFPFKTNFITGDSITVDATGITYNLEGSYGSTKVYDAATKTWAKAEYQSVTPTEDAKVSEAFYAWWEANIMVKLATPTDVQVADDEASWNEVENATQYEIVVDSTSWGTHIPAVYNYTYDEATGVLTLLDAPYEQNGYTVTITDDSTTIVTKAAKGDIITIEDKQYRVLKVNGDIAEVLAMYDASTSQIFGSKSNYNMYNIYADDSLDKYCGQTFYNSLSTDIQNAIVAKTFKQDFWYPITGTWSSEGNPQYWGVDASGSGWGLGYKNEVINSISRKCYVLSCQDIIDYLDVTTSMKKNNTTLTSENVQKMFWNQTTSSDSVNIWLRSGSTSNPNYNTACIVYKYGVVGATNVKENLGVRPAFQIDLSKISWSK